MYKYIGIGITIISLIASIVYSSAVTNTKVNYNSTTIIELQEDIKEHKAKHEIYEDKIMLNLNAIKDMIGAINTQNGITNNELVHIKQNIGTIEKTIRQLHGNK